jgi:hypothetical protein
MAEEIWQLSHLDNSMSSFRMHYDVSFKVLLEVIKNITDLPFVTHCSLVDRNRTI